MQNKTESKNLYETVFNKLDDCIVIYKVHNDGEDFKFVDINDSSQSLEKIKREELIGKNVTDTFPGVKDLGLFDVFVEVYKSGKTIDHPLKFYEDKRISGYRENVVFKLDEDHIIAVYSDVTKEKQAEQDLKKTMAFLESHQLAMDKSAIVSKADLIGNITYVNDNFTKVTGYTKDEVIGKPHSILRHPNNSKEIFKDLWKTIKSKKVWKKILENRDKYGNDYWVDITILPILDDNENIVEYIAVRYDITKTILQQNKLDTIANTDILTGLGNRYKLNNDIKDSTSPALAILNLDNFSQINDFYGHETGDYVIKEFGKKIDLLRYDDNYFIYHLQGDEYVLLNLNINRELFLKNILEVLDKLKNTTVDIRGEDTSFNFSTAISFENKDTILITADMALKVAKRGSRDFIIYDEDISLNNEYENNIKWSKKVKEAIQDDNIVPVFHPIVNNTNGLWEKYESLVRLQDNSQLISPYFFLEISKKTKHYTKITKIMIQKSFEMFKDKGFEFSLNLTVEDMLDEEINRYIFEMLERYEIGSRVVFEIVESESIENFEEILHFITKIKSYGSKIAIDDFGTGYSNFEYLMRLNADYIKVDGSLIKDIDTNKNAQIVVSTIVDFAKKMGIKTIAEYVENESIYNKVKELGMDYSQGYYFSEPKKDLGIKKEL